MNRLFSSVQKIALIFMFTLFFFLGFSFWFEDESRLTPEEMKVSPLTQQNGTFVLPSNLIISGDLTVKGEVNFDNSIRLKNLAGQILKVDQEGKLTGVKQSQLFADGGVDVFNTYIDQEQSLVADENLFYLDDSDVGLLGLGTSSPAGKLHIDTTNSDTVGLVVQTEVDQTADILQIRHSGGQQIARFNYQGKLILDNNADHQIELRPSGNTGWLSSSGGSIFIENSYNIGTGLGIYSNAGAEAEGNMINVKVDNEDYAQAAFYMNYDGTSNAVEIVANTDDTSSNALSITNYNQLDSALGVIGYETGRGTVKITHKKEGYDANASGLSIDLQGDGTAAQGIYVDSTATGGTSGNLLRLRNQSIDRFVVNNLGSLTFGSNGTDTFMKKLGNVEGDEFYVGTNAAFRVQRAATDSEAFRTQVVGDVHGRWLGTADGKLKFGDGQGPQDVVVERISEGLMQLDGDFQIVSQSTNNDAFIVKASDGSSLLRFTETGGGASWFEMYDASGGSKIRFRGDNGDSYFNSGNLSFGTTSIGDNASKVIAIGNGTAPTSSIADGVQIWAEDVAGSSELRVRDEAGTTTTLSPHNFSILPQGPSEKLAWSYYAQKDGKAISADITRALRLVEAMSGEKLIYIKDLETGEYLEREDPLIEILKKDTDEGLVDQVREMLTGVVFRAQAVFEDTVSFMGDTFFKGSITVNASTAGTVEIPAGTKKFRINFAQPFRQIPIVYLTSLSSDFNYQITEVDKEGFSIFVLGELVEPVSINWLALVGENGNFSQLEILDGSF